MSFGDIVMSDDFGAHWRNTSAGIADWTGVTSSQNDGSIVVAIDSDSRVLRSTDAGVTWQLSLKGIEPLKLQMDDTAAVGRFTGIAASFDGSFLALVQSRGYIYSSANAGGSWRRYSDPMVGNWSSVASSSDGVILVAAQYTDSSGQPGYLFISRDRGYNWDRLESAGRGYWSQVSLFENVYISAIQDMANRALWSSGDLGQSWLRDINPSAGIWVGIDMCSKY